MADTFRLEITTPERMVVREDVEEAQVPARNGYLGVMPGHAPLLAQLKPGALTFRNGGQTTTLAISGGFLEVLPDQARALVETAERACEIDVTRAEKARQRAEERLRASKPDVDIDRATVALERAIVRLQVAGRSPGH